MKKKLNSNNKFIPVNTPKIYNSEKTYVQKCLTSGWLSSEGKFVKEFEKKFSTYNKRKFGISVSNGTAALEIALWFQPSELSDWTPSDQIWREEG